MPLLIARLATLLGGVGIGSYFASKDDNNAPIPKPNLTAQLIPHIVAALCAKFLFQNKKFGKEVFGIDLSRIAIYIVVYLITKNIVDQTVVHHVNSIDGSDPNSGDGGSSNYDPQDVDDLETVRDGIEDLQNSGMTSSFSDTKYASLADKLHAAMDGCGVTDYVFPNVFGQCRNVLDVEHIIEAFGLRYVQKCVWTSIWLGPTSDTKKGLVWHMEKEGVDILAVNVVLTNNGIDYEF